MRDRRFVATHRGGPLTLVEHHALVAWACACVEHVMPLRADVDKRVHQAMIVAEEWVRGTASVGDARRASLNAIAVANSTDDVVASAVARAAGHAVATAHMADHAPKAALYAVQAVQHAGADVDVERRWQRAQIPDAVFVMVEQTLDAQQRTS